MKIIVSHSYIDFDCLAAMYGASKLFPDARIVIPGSMASNVKEFVRLHHDLIAYFSPAEIELSQVNHVVLVDTHQISRTGALYPFLKTHGEITYSIYDHHPAMGKREVLGKKEVIRPCGAATTLMVEELEKRKIRVTAIEATLLALGIYEDTGNLSFSSTTAQDLDAAAYLLRQGADLAVINRYVNFALSDEQHSLLNSMLAIARREEVDGFSILLCAGVWPTPVEGLAIVTQKMMEMENSDIAFSIVKMGEKTFLVGRSRIPEVKVNVILSSYGGGGHAGAAAAWSTRTDIDAMAEDILSKIRQQIPREVLAQDIMSSPVRTADPELSVENARLLMARYGHNAITVAKGGRIMGLLTRKDADKAIQLGFGGESVQKFMSRSLHRVQTDTPFHQIHQTMVEKDIGRLLVMDGKRLVGIITRTDLLRLLYRRDRGSELPSKKALDFAKTFSGFQSQMILRLGEIAQKLNMRIYLVGGCVRDLILGAVNPDIDMVVEGNAHRLAMALKKEYPEITLKIHPEYGTASLHFPNGDKMDLATARTEFYPRPGAKPEVEHSSLKQDLYRRDFTINALALELNPDHAGEVTDFFGGLQDIEARTLRILHNLSFIEDPIRILRAVRFEVKLGFQMEPATLSFARDALETGEFDCFFGDRLKQELKYGFSSPSVSLYFERLTELGGIRIIEPSLMKKGKSLLERIKKTERLLLWYRSLPQLTPAEEWIVYLFAVLQDVIISKRDKIAENLRLAQYKKVLLKKGFNSQKRVLDEIERAQRRSQRYFILKEYPVETLLFWMIEAGPGARKQLQEFIEVDRFSKISISGEDLINIGLEPGPAFNRILRRVMEVKLDEGLRSKAQEMAFVKRILQKESQ